MPEASETYTPERFDDDHVKVLVRIRACVVCKKPTVPGLQQNHVSPFPAFYRANFAAQMERAGIALVGSWNDSDPICAACHDAGTVTGECTLCHEQRKLSDMEEKIGLPSEYMCKPCYETVPAKTWATELARLEESHRWDFE
jgi:hypothetical protein